MRDKEKVMIRHCVMFKWADGATDEAKAAVSAGLDELAKLEVIAAYHHGPDAQISDGNWDYVAVGDFASVADYQAYAVAADHVELIANVIRPNISARAAVQYNI